MLINKNTRIIGDKVILVPYREEHVLKYHYWMMSVELQTLTNSEPLTLEEEYNMQKSWMSDPYKCTFIILDKEMFDGTQCEILSMIGDTNIFLVPLDPQAAEAEIMIAEVSARGKHCGWEAMLILLHYGIVKLDMKLYFVKISYTNIPSRNMFRKMGFLEVNFCSTFREVTMEKKVDEDFKTWLATQVEYEIQEEINE